MHCQVPVGGAIRKAFSQVSVLQQQALLVQRRCPFSAATSSIDQDAGRRRGGKNNSVEKEEANPFSSFITATRQYAPKGDSCPARQFRDTTTIPPDNSSLSTSWINLCQAEAARPNKQVTVIAQEMDMMTAAQNLGSFDKIMLLMNHCEEENRGSNQGDMPLRPLSDRGVGQALNLSRRTSLFCNDETGLIPQLVVVAGSKASLQTALYAFPQYSPFSARFCPWLCNPSASSGQQLGAGASFATIDPMTGVDYSPCHDQDPSTTAACGTATEVLERVESFLLWLQGRPERVVVVSTDSQWLQALGCLTLYSDRAEERFAQGELRAIGLGFII